MSETLNLKVEGMTCGHCVRAVTRAVQALDPAARVEVDLGAKTVTVGAGVSAEQVAAAIAAEGYAVTTA